jgi:hypothetical protein
VAKTVKLSDDLIAIARAEGQVMLRSIGAQVEYWARIGREVEASGALGAAGVRKLLAGSGSVQGLGERDDSVYVDLLEKKLEALDGSDTRILDDLRAGGHPIVAIDERGELVTDERRPKRKKARAAR